MTSAPVYRLPCGGQPVYRADVAPIVGIVDSAVRTVRVAACQIAKSDIN